MMANDRALTLSARLNRLFETFRTASQPEQPLEDVARSISEMLDQPVSSTCLAALRRGDHDQIAVAPKLLTALAEHFRVPPAYLIGDGAEVAVIDRELRLLASARDAGVHNLTLRGAVDAAELADQLSYLATTHPPTPDPQN